MVVALSSEPEAHVLKTRAFLIELEVRCVGFEERGKPSTWRKTSGSRDENQQQTHPRYDMDSGIETGSHWWEVSAPIA